MTTSARSRVGAVAAALAFAVSLGGCYNTGTVILLPEKDGANAAVDVKQGKDTYTLDKPYAAVKQWPAGGQPYTSDPKEVDARFGAALAAQPVRPESLPPLYFLEGKDELTPESKQVFETVFVEISKYPFPDLVVVGHTDSVGNDKLNEDLSLKRARAVQAMLVERFKERGISSENIVVVGRGKRELLVPTADNVAEPRNRRVVIEVR
jgi:outer membrane protein OmpA-like peptidoglycan-associated protein